MWGVVGSVSHAPLPLLSMPPANHHAPRLADAVRYMNASGDWRAAAGLVQANVYDAAALLAFTQALEALPPAMVSLAVTGGCVDAVLMALRAHTYQQALQCSGCRAFTTLAAASPYCAPHALGVGGMDTLLTSLRIYAGIADNTEAALHALAALIQGAAPSSQTAATVAGVTSDVLAAMRTHDASAGVARAACTALAYLVSGLPASQALAGQAGGVGAVLRALRVHPEAEEAAVWALANLIDGFPVNLKRAQEFGAAGTAVQLLASDSANVAAQAARILALLTACAPGLAASSCVAGLVGAMAAHPIDIGVQVYGCSALCALTEDDAGLYAAMRAGAAQVVARALLLPAFEGEARELTSQLLEALRDAQRMEAAEQEAAAQTIQFGTAGPLAQPLPLLDADTDVAVQFGTFGDAAGDDAPGPAEVPASASDETEQRVASPNTMVEHLDQLMPWLRLDAGPSAAPAAPAPASPAAVPLSPPNKGLPAPLPLAALLASPASPAAAPKAVPAPLPLAAAVKPPVSASPPAQPLPAPKPAFAAPKARTAADEERELCVVCLHERICVALLPCRHFPVCASAECAAMLGQPPLCPICRIPVAERVVIAPPPRAAKPPGANAWAKPLPGAPLPPLRPACAGGCGTAPSTLFLPCRHLALCGEARCAVAAGAKGAQCPSCHAKATAAIPLFMP